MEGYCKVKVKHIKQSLYNYHYLASKDNYIKALRAKARTEKSWFSFREKDLESKMIKLHLELVQRDYLHIGYDLLLDRYNKYFNRIQEYLKDTQGFDFIQDKCAEIGLKDLKFINSHLNYEIKEKYWISKLNL